MLSIKNLFFRKETKKDKSDNDYDYDTVTCKDSVFDGESIFADIDDDWDDTWDDHFPVGHDNDD